MMLTGVLEVWRPAETEHTTLYHEACYVPKADDLKVELIGVPDETFGQVRIWIDPGCAVCGEALAVYPLDEEMDNVFENFREEE